MKEKRFSLKKRLCSFKYAFQGIGYLFRNEHNAWIHLFVAVCVITAGFLLRVNIGEWIAIIFAIGMVLVAEAFNTAIEALSDAISPNYNQLIKRAKDVAAGGVLLAVIAAVVIGLIIFIPKLAALF